MQHNNVEMKFTSACKWLSYVDDMQNNYASMKHETFAFQ